VLFYGFEVLVTFSEGSDDAGVYEVLAEDFLVFLSVNKRKCSQRRAKRA